MPERPGLEVVLDVDQLRAWMDEVEALLRELVAVGWRSVEHHTVLAHLERMKAIREEVS